jgi:hypothetical protein
LFDQNISHRILQYLPAELHAATIKSEGLINASDRTIWDFALKNEFIIVTQDSDFKYPPDQPILPACFASGNFAAKRFWTWNIKTKPAVC